MIVRVYSKVNPGELLHLINEYKEFRGVRDLCPKNEGIQVASMVIPEDKMIRAHKHVARPRCVERTQKTWVILSGKVRVKMFDVDGVDLAEVVLNPGTCIVTFGGGCSYASEGGPAAAYEVKVGPCGESDRKEIEA